MYNCDCLIHPFQNDPGTSQSDRVMDDLLTCASKIDARTLADLLDYFMQMSRHINFYDKSLNVSDWKPFFEKSIPFTLASVIKTPLPAIEQNLAFYNTLFEKKHSSTGLQLQAYFIFYRCINKINDWHLSVKHSGLPIESFLEILIKDKLQQPLKLFIGYTNAAVKWYGIKKIDFSKLGDNPVWNLAVTDLYSLDNSFKTGTYSKFKQMEQLYQKIKTIAVPFFNAVNTIATAAENNLEASLLPLKEELQKSHPPHLALLFAFLTIFRQLQNDLNGFTRKHLDFFYKDVLQIKSQGAGPDKAHIVFEIQKQLEKYLVKKGLLVKDGKDNNKQEILFSLDDDIVVNKTEVAETKTLFLNNQSVLQQTYVEGIYIANDATKADGIDKDFTDDQPKNFSTLGAKLSKYSDPETKIIQPYANARIGFILASPVLYLKEGTRTITMSIACQLNDSICSDLGNDIITVSKNCCDDPASGGSPGPVPKNQYPDYLNSQTIFTQIQTNISKQYIYLNETIFKQAISKGLSEDLIQMFRYKFLKDVAIFKPCYCDVPVYKTESSVVVDDWNAFIIANIIDPGVQKLINEIFIPESVLNLFFSGDKDWLQPATNNITMSNLVINSTGGTFVLTINATINPDQPAVTFYDKDSLKEDFGTTQPLVKIELNERLKFDWTITKLLPDPDQERPCCDQDESCCLFKDAGNLPQMISYYQFFRNITVLKNIGPDNTRIDVQVCGLKNFIVQNDESLQDVNGPVYPFGTRPQIIDFDIKNPPSFPLVTNLNLIGPNFYIGSKEIFCKKWKEVYINIDWKNKPTDFRDYYKGYLKDGGLFGLDDNKFLINISVLENGIWIKENSHAIPATVPVKIKGNNYNDRKLFVDDGATSFCLSLESFMQTIRLQNNFFTLDQQFRIDSSPVIQYDVNAANGFLKLNMQMQDFCHKVYSYVLARQMMALGKLPDGKIEDAIYYDATSGNLIVFSTNSIKSDLINAAATATRVEKDINDPNQIKDKAGNLGSGTISSGDADDIRKIILPPTVLHPSNKNLTGDVIILRNEINGISDIIDNNDKFQAIIPNEPWTPIISGMALDYTATANIEDIALIHLYPYAGTYSHESIKLTPTLFPTFCDEGTLFLGLKNLVPGNNLNLLFELSEATSDSESEKEAVQWHYLDSNVWKPLRTGFEVLDDATENLTTSGVIKLALPANMTSDNTVMPDGLHWIKASVPQNSKAVSETTGIYPQAISVTFTNDDANDKLRLSQPLPAGSISKLSVADANVKSVQQPYDSFGGEVPEIQQQYYVRVSEELRHKGRAIQKFDYERLALQEFPQIFKAKCINHSFALDAHLYKNDFPYSPGYIILAVIPDLNKLKAGNSFEPKVPVSILEKIETYIRKRTSPFVRFRAMNPRYEEINFCLRVNLLPGKDQNYYKEQLKEDLKELLAPWAVGKYDKLTFGQCVYRSDVIRFLENTDYVDFITDFKMGKAGKTPLPDNPKICPDTPRSILIAGNIEVCINQPGCDEWEMCYDDSQNKTDCCTTELIPVADYCINNIIGLK